MHDRLNLDRVQTLLRTERVGRSVTYLDSTGSTMDVARDEAERGAPDGALVVAEEQTAGRGREGRAWISPAGVNLYVTLVMRPAITELRCLPVIAPLAVCQAIEETTALLPRIKWPNDVLIDGRKVAGLLPVSDISDASVRFALIGIGINVNVNITRLVEIRDIATSLRMQAGRKVAREEVLAATLNHFEELYDSACRGEVVSVGWKRRLDTLGREIRVAIADRSEQGVVVDADSDGALILRRDDGSHIRIDAGEALLRDG